MPRERKIRRRDEAPSREIAAAPEEAALPAARPDTPPAERSLHLPYDGDDGGRYRIVRRHGGWLTVAIAVLLVLIPLISWLRYHTQNVTSNNATVQAHLAEIGTRVNGLVRSINVDAGDRVRAGDILVQLEDRHLAAEVEEARAELTGLERSLEVKRLDIVVSRDEARQQVEEAEAKVAAADAQRAAATIRAEEAKRRADLQGALYEKGGAISGEEVKSAESNRRTADALAREADANYVAARSANQAARLATDALAVREQEVAILEADVMRARARLQRADAELSSASIRAPEDGAIVRRFVQPGGSVKVGEPIISMWLGNEVWVEAWIDEDDIGAVTVGSGATLTLQAFPEREFAGTVDRIGLVTDFELPDAEVPQPRYRRMRGAPVVGVRIRLLDPPEELLPGLSAMVAIEKPGG